MSKVKAIALSTILISGLSTGISSAATMSNIVKFSVSATGANVTMSQNMNKAGAKMGMAMASFTVDTTKNTLCSVISTMGGLTNVLEAHIHAGAAGVDGADVVPFDVKKFNTKAPVCQKVAAAVVAKMLANPAGFYLNVHTKAQPDGAVRGQVMKG